MDARLRVVAFSDLHIDAAGGDGGQRRVLDAIRGALEALAPDVVLFAGDLANDLNPVRRTLEALRVAEHCLFVPGNHDAWLSERERAEFAGSDDHLRRLAGLVRTAGWHWLPGAPQRVGGWAFAGAMGWFDRGFLDPRVPANERDYARGEWGGVRWNDHARSRFGIPDEAVAARERAQLAADLAALGVTEAGGPPAVVVTHHLPFAELLVVRPDDPAWQFCQAFMGSPAIGELIASRPSIRLAVAGHTHAPHDLAIAGLRAIVSPFGYRGTEEWPADVRERLATLVLHPDGRIERE